MTEQLNDLTIFSAMQEGTPYGTYQKTILAKVHVTVLNPFSKEPEGLILSGEPGSDSSLVRTWDIKEDVFFKRINKRHFEQGTIIPFKAKHVEKPVDMLEQSTDEDLDTMLDQPFYSLQSALNKTESEALVSRILAIARKKDKSEKIIANIQKRLAEIQSIKVKEQAE
jgi:hypothetical protein